MSTSAADPFERARATVGVFLSLAGIACGMTMLYMGMRSVMSIGGFCAEGGPYVIQQPCPKGVPLLVMGGLWGGIISYAIYIWQTIKHKVPGFALLGWSVLFVSLGWNFLEFGLDPPGPDGGLAWGWLICAVFFVLMGGLPLLAVVKPTFAGFFGEVTKTPNRGALSSVAAAASLVRERARRSKPS